jgi:hypothetical protein
MEQLATLLSPPTEQLGRKTLIWVEGWLLEGHNTYNINAGNTIEQRNHETTEGMGSNLV